MYMPYYGLHYMSHTQVNLAQFMGSQGRYCYHICCMHGQHEETTKNHTLLTLHLLSCWLVVWGIFCSVQPISCCCSHIAIQYFGKAGESCTCSCFINSCYCSQFAIFCNLFMVLGAMVKCTLVLFSVCKLVAWKRLFG